MHCYYKILFFCLFISLNFYRAKGSSIPKPELNNFLVKLDGMRQNMTAFGVQWHEDGKTIVVLNKEQLMHGLYGKKDSNPWLSFIRQLNIYKFRIIKMKGEQGVFYHIYHVDEKFNKDNPDAIYEIKTHRNPRMKSRVNKSKIKTIRLKPDRFLKAETASKISEKAKQFFFSIAADSGIYFSESQMVENNLDTEQQLID